MGLVMKPEQTFSQWDWTQPATMHVGLKAEQLGLGTPALAKQRREGVGPAYQQLGPHRFMYWADGRTRLEQLAYLRSVTGDAA